MVATDISNSWNIYSTTCIHEAFFGISDVWETLILISIAFSCDCTVNRSITRFILIAIALGLLYEGLYECTTVSKQLNLYRTNV